MSGAVFGIERRDTPKTAPGTRCGGGAPGGSSEALDALPEDDDADDDEHDGHDRGVVPLEPSAPPLQGRVESAARDERGGDGHDDGRASDEDERETEYEDADPTPEMTNAPPTGEAFPWCAWRDSNPQPSDP